MAVMYSTDLPLDRGNVQPLLLGPGRADLREVFTESGFDRLACQFREPIWSQPYAL